ncbi:GAP1-N2 domain-containing protein [Clostridium hydrogenum]|uniref:GAP1-N2 domain-containing protein n=1 Tax=Clostridium hydrogenum TaxID=2855764 RepID=UPI001F2F7C53|nr:hypothetical protein [Clostridium hydrogenum]
MKIYQLYYTSCKKGLTSGMGFQTYSMSEGITEEERQEIERHCNYIEPSSLTSNPTDEEIKENFPIAFSFFKLKNGKSCICKIKYKGKDYSGRFGNYFCHVLIWDAGELPFYPIEIYNSRIFKDGLTEEEENEEDIRPLPILNHILEEDFITTSDIEKFLKGASLKKRTKSLNDLIDGIIDAKESDKKIVFSDDPKNLHMWIAAATMALPLSMANSITFNTYSFNAFNAGEFLCGGLEENLGTQLNNTNKNYKFNVFNFKLGNSSEVELKTKFAKQAALEYTIIKDYRKDIIDFIEAFNYKKVDSNIDNCVNLFSIINNGLQKVNDVDAVNAIAFANKYGSESTLEKIMSTIDAEALNKITTNLNLKMAEVMFKFLFRISKITEKPEYINKAYEFFFDSIQFMVIDGKDINIEDILKLYQDIRNYNEDNLQKFVSKSAYGERLRNIAVYLEGGLPRHAQFYFCSIIGDFMELKIPWEYFGKNVNFKKFIVICLKVLLGDKNKFMHALRYVQDYADYFSNVVNIAYEVCTARENYIVLVSSYTDILYEISFYKSTEIVKKLVEKMHGADILIESFKYKIRSTTDKVSYFNSYCTNIFDENVDYRNRYFSEALEVLISVLQKYEFNMSFYENLTKYIRTRKLERNLGKKLSERLVDEFQNLVPIKLPDETEIAIIAEIDNIKYLYKMDIRPDISEIIQCADSLYNEKVYIEEFLCNDDIFKFDGISKEKYEAILDLMFKIICPLLNDILSHMKMKRILMYEKYMVTYFNTYMLAMEDIFDSKGTNKIYLDFICFIIKSQSLFSEKQFKDIEENIVINISSVDTNRIEGYDKYIQKTIENSTRGEETRDAIRTWMEMYKAAKKESEGKSIFNKLQQKIYKK